MILWHLGTTLAVLWFVFRGNTRLDYRLAMVGALLPDLIDKPLGRIILRERYQSGRLWGHALLLHVALFCVLFFLRGRIKRRAVMLPIGSLLHLAEDGTSLWNRPQMLWWPLFGLQMPPGAEKGLAMYVTPSGVASEVAGALLLVWVFAAHGMLSKRGIRDFLRTGRLELAKEAA